MLSLEDEGRAGVGAGGWEGVFNSWYFLVICEFTTQLKITTNPPCPPFSSCNQRFLGLVVKRNIWASNFDKRIIKLFYYAREGHKSNTELVWIYGSIVMMLKPKGSIHRIFHDS